MTITARELLEALRKAADRLEDAATVLDEDGMTSGENWRLAAEEARALVRRAEAEA